MEYTKEDLMEAKRQIDSNFRVTRLHNASHIRLTSAVR